MHKNPLNEGVVSANSVGTGPVTRAMVHARTRELALIAGRGPSGATQADYEQAKRELTGQTDMDRQDELLDALPESKRWDPVPGSEGRQTAEPASEDEDNEGRSESAQLVEEGVGEAERDQMLQAAKLAAQTDRGEG